MSQTRVMQRKWGLGLIVIGVAVLISSRLGDNVIVSILLDTLVLVIGLLLPLPPRLEARIYAWPLLARAGAVIGIMLVVLAVLIGVSALIDPLLIPIGLLVVGVVLLFRSSRLARP